MEKLKQIQVKSLTRDAKLNGNAIQQKHKRD
jgi:hypothetical protein